MPVSCEAPALSTGAATAVAGAGALSCGGSARGSFWCGAEVGTGSEAGLSWPVGGARDACQNQSSAAPARTAPRSSTALCAHTPVKTTKRRGVVGEVKIVRSMCVCGVGVCVVVCLWDDDGDEVCVALMAAG